MSAAGGRAGRALVCAPVPLEYDLESGSRRIYHMVEFLLEAGWTVAFVCENAPTDSRHLHHLRQRGVATFVGFDGATADLVQGGAFDIAIFAFWYIADRYAGMVRRLSPETRILVETVDLHWLRNARRVLGGRNGRDAALDASYGGDLVAELNAYAAADAVTTVSTKEADLVNDIAALPGLARAVPDCDGTSPSGTPFEERRGILFVGNFRHPPNLDAVQYLCEEIVPLLPARVRAEHPLLIVGNGLDGRVAELTRGCGGVRLVGWVPSLEPYFHAARASVVPLRYGAGTKRKLIQALLAGTPSVATPAGVEGMEIVDGRHALVASDAPSFALALEQILTDPELWSRLASEGRSAMLATHGRAVARDAFHRTISEVLQRPAKGASARPSSSSDGRMATYLGDVESVVPEGAEMLVVSKGDPELLRITARTARHFPAGADGEYAGFHPRDSRSAVRHLSEVRQGADYLVFPAASFWWLDYYGDFARHLAAKHEQVLASDACAVFRLRPARVAEPAGERSAQTRNAADAADIGPGRTVTHSGAMVRSARGTSGEVMRP